MTTENHAVADTELTSAETVLDPGIRRFVNEVATSYASYPRDDARTPAAERRIAEEVRAPWREGGPAMVRTVELTVPTRHGKLRARLHDPDASTPKPVLIYLHGGGFTLFSIDTHDRVMREYAARGGFAVLGIDYPLSPESKFPAPLEAVVDAIRWTATQARALGLDGARIAVGGDSAGANLSIGACRMLRDAGEGSLVSAMLLNYGAFGPDISAEAERRYGGPDFMLTTDEMRYFWGNYLPRAEDSANPLVTPLLADQQGLPAAFVTIPECDILTQQSHAMAKQLRAAGVDVTDIVYPGATHSFLEAVSVSPMAERALQDGASWLRGRWGGLA